jgi:hypothetical protein
MLSGANPKNNRAGTLPHVFTPQKWPPNAGNPLSATLCLAYTLPTAQSKAIPYELRAMLIHQWLLAMADDD